MDILIKWSLLQNHKNTCADRERHWYTSSSNALTTTISTAKEGYGDEYRYVTGTSSRERRTSPLHEFSSMYNLIMCRQSYQVETVGNSTISPLM